MECDILIQGGTVMPGDGGGFPADIAVRGDQIVAVQPGIASEGVRRVIDATGLWVCPGFIDMHAHSALQSFEDPYLLPKIAQGFTTEVLHPDGLAPAPVQPAHAAERQAYLRALEGEGPPHWNWSSFAEYLRALDATQPVTTLVPSIGHNAIRDYVMGSENREPTSGELAAMRQEIRAASELGARTFSLGLIYLPGVFSRTAELLALAREAALAQIPLVPHIRNEGAGVLDAVREMVEIAQKSGASLHISHLKVVGNAHLVEPLLELIDQARREIDISFDQYPYGAGSTLLSALLPPWALEGGPQTIMKRLAHPATRQRIEGDISRGLTGWENLYRSCGPENVVIAGAASSRQYDVGKSLRDISLERNVSSIDAALDLLRDTALNVTMVDHYATEETIRTVFQHPLALVGSDGIFGPRPHPRLYGTAARVLGRYALRERLISAQEAIARLTARAADRLGLADRGRIAVRLRADLVLLDPQTYLDNATYEEPRRLPSGVHYVLVGGQAAWENGGPTGTRSGGVWGQ
ncbi:MAG: N-acyl-D-amino-acid deacylase family protein [Bacilli bacterium]